MATKKATPEVKKAGTVSTSSVKTETTKTAAVQKTVKAEPAKAAAKKPAAKKTAAKKTSAKKDIKVKAIVEYYGKQVEEKEIIASVHKAGRGSRLLCDQRCGHRSGCLLGTSGRNGKIARGAIFFPFGGEHKSDNNIFL